MDRVALSTDVQTGVSENGSPVFSVSSATSGVNRYLLDWSKITAKSAQITVKSHSCVDVLEIGANAEGKLDLIVEAGANVVWHTLYLAQANRLAFSADLGERSTLRYALADFSHGTVVLQANVRLSGNDASLLWRIAVRARKNDDKLYDISFVHEGRDTFAQMSNYGVAEDQSRLRFTGTSHIVHGAHGSKTHQTAKIMVFDPKSIGQASPVLKIDENDIEASHAAAVGKVNDEHLFYLCSRGLTPEDAKRLITAGYLNPILNEFDEKGIKARISRAIARR